MNECAFCQTDKMKSVKTNYERTIGGRKIIVKNVPALYCETCGEYYFDKKVLIQVHEKINQARSIPENIEIYDFSSETSKELVTT